MKIKVDTRFNKGMISQSILSDDDNSVIRGFTKQIIQLQEQGVIDALIALGWTPPKGVHGSNEHINKKD